MKTWFIYRLFAKDLVTRYIGQTTNPAARLDAITDPRRGGTCGPLLKAWAMRHVGNVRMDFYEGLSADNQADADRLEIEQIASWRADGFPLLNIQDGGHEKYKDAVSVFDQMERVLAHWKTCQKFRPDDGDWAMLKELIRRSAGEIAYSKHGGRKR